MNEFFFMEEGGNHIGIFKATNTSFGPVHYYAFIPYSAIERFFKEHIFFKWNKAAILLHDESCNHTDVGDTPINCLTKNYHTIYSQIELDSGEKISTSYNYAKLNTTMIGNSTS